MTARRCSSACATWSPPRARRSHRALAPRPATDVFGPLVGAAAAAATTAEYALVLESVLEGYLLHYGRPRLLDTDDGPAAARGRLHVCARPQPARRLGDLEAVRALADLITLSARAREAGGATDDKDCAGLWALSALAVGAGPWPGYERQLPPRARAAPTPAGCSQRRAPGGRAGHRA